MATYNNGLMSSNTTNLDRVTTVTAPRINTATVDVNKLPTMSTSSIDVGNLPSMTTQNIDPAVRSDIAQRTIDKNTETVQGQLAGILDKGSPLMQRAETKALQSMNARGLMNSGLTIGAAQNAVIDAAMPIAQSDASIYGNVANLNTTTENQFRATYDADRNQNQRLNAAQENNTRQFNTGNQVNATTHNMDAENQTRQFNTANQVNATNANAAAENQTNQFNASNEFKATMSMLDEKIKQDAMQHESELNNRQYAATLGNSYMNLISRIQESDAPAEDKAKKMGVIKSVFADLLMDIPGYGDANWEDNLQNDTGNSEVPGVVSNPVEIDGKKYTATLNGKSLTQNGSKTLSDNVVRYLFNDDSGAEYRYNPDLDQWAKKSNGAWAVMKNGAPTLSAVVDAAEGAPAVDNAATGANTNTNTVVTNTNTATNTGGLMNAATGSEGVVQGANVTGQTPTAEQVNTAATQQAAATQLGTEAEQLAARGGSAGNGATQTKTVSAPSATINGKPMTFDKVDGKFSFFTGPSGGKWRYNADNKNWASFTGGKWVAGKGPKLG